MFSKLIKKSAEKAVNDYVTENLDGAIYDAIERVIRKDTTRELSKIGFGSAFHMYLKEKWPTITLEESVFNCWDYLKMAGINYGDSDFIWNADSANDIACEYADQFGE